MKKLCFLKNALHHIFHFKGLGEETIMVSDNVIKCLSSYGVLLEIMFPFIVKELTGVSSKKEPKFRAADFFTEAVYTSSMNVGVA